MADHGYLYTDALALRIYQGRKGATRRPMSRQNTVGFDMLAPALTRTTAEQGYWPQSTDCRVRVGDTMWVRECFAIVWNDAYPCDCVTTTKGYCPAHDTIEYRADTGAAAPGGWDNAPPDERLCRWTPSIHMPRWAARSVRVVTSVHAERLEPLSQAEADVEGFDTPEEFASVWDAVYGARGIGMVARPWVWRIGWE